MNFQKLETYLGTLYDAGVPGCDLEVRKDHETVFRMQKGFRDEQCREPMTGDETFNLYSCTKVFTSCAAMQLLEEGKIRLDDPVSKYLPSFSELTVKCEDRILPAKNTMTLRFLLSMQSGLDYELDTPQIREILEKTGGHATTVQLAEAFGRTPLSFEPGEDFQYSLSHDVMGAVIEAVSGMSLSEYLQTHIFDPLGLKTIGFSLKEEDRCRQCAQYDDRNGEAERIAIGRTENMFALSDRFESGGAGLVSDVSDCIAFADALACRGTGMTGAQILHPETIQIWNSNQLGPRSRKTFDTWNRKGYSYALGVRTRVDRSTGGAGGIGEFGWDGAAGSWMMIDPDLHLSAFYAMHVMNFGYCYDVIHPTIRSLIYEGLRL